MQEKAGDLGNILVYEDERVEGRWKGAWRVGCTLEGNKSTFYFRFWDKGMPEALGEDTMLDAVRQFQEQFKPDGIYQLGSNYKIDVDWEKAVAISTYPVKRFSQPKP